MEPRLRGTAEGKGSVNDWRFIIVGLILLVVALMLLFRPKESQAFSKQFEEGKTLVPFPPLVGVPVWAIRLFGVVALGSAALFFYLFISR